MHGRLPDLIEALSATRSMTVEEAGRTMLSILSGGDLSPEAFLARPGVLIRPDQGIPRYVAQVAWRAVSGNYKTVGEIVSSLSGILDRNPPVLEPASPDSNHPQIVVPEARILRVHSHGPGREATFEAWVTSGELHDREITVRVSPSVNRTAFDAVSMFWVHASVALYNLVRVSRDLFEARPDSFFILEPLRQVNATTVARSLDCAKPEIDRMRRGRGDTTVHTLRGLVVHGILDCLIAGEEDLDVCYRKALSPFLGQLAAVVDDDFDEDAFRNEALRHARGLRGIVRDNPHMRSDPQVEVRRYSPTLGIQGRIDAVFRSGDQLDVVELKTGKRLRKEDHAQLYVYRLLLSDLVRRTRREEKRNVELTSRLISSYDGRSTPARPGIRFDDVIDARNRLIALIYALGETRPHVPMPYADYDARVCGKCPSWTRSRCRDDSKLFGDRPGSSETADLGYFRRFSTLVRREGWAEGEDLAVLLDDSRIRQRVRDFRTIENARFAGREHGIFAFEFAENHSELAAGDRVLIHGGEISSQTSYQGYIRSVEATSVRIAVPLHNLDPETFLERPQWIIDRLTVDLTAEASQTALYDFLSSGMDARKQVVLGDLSAAYTPAPGSIPGSGTLNASQEEAVGRASSCRVFHLIWGPPGTGKTRIIPEIVSSIAGAVLLGAFTNTALDNMLMSLLDREPEARFLRLGRSESSPELAERLGSRAASSFSEDLSLAASSARDLRSRMDAIPVIAATAHRASSHPYLRQRPFEMAIVDEAGQLTEPLSLGLVMRARRFVLIGDDRQLPPVVRTPGLEISLFERLKSQCEAEMPGAITLLDTQYRMHPAIMNIPNRLYYGGRLSSGVDASDREPPDGGPLAFVPVEAREEGRANAAEAEVVVAIVRKLLAGAPPESIGVISPFRAQVALLRQKLAGTGVTADTVERYQGGERDIVIISFVRSRGTGFVFDDRRLNVAITRARRKLILVAHPELFRNTKFGWISEYQ